MHNKAKSQDPAFDKEIDMLAPLTVFLGCMVAALAAPYEESEGEIWAVLVKGGLPEHAGWQDDLNYELEANVYHAYQIFKRHGIPDSNIIVMVPDNVAYDPRNPKPGVIINRPGGPNVYENVIKDYTGDDVNADNFLNVLSGNKEAMAGIGSGKVLESGPNDHVFVFFSDHGGPGVLSFPTTTLYAHDLINTLTYMENSNMFKELVFYVEACQAGSMFDNLLPNNVNIFAVTASNPREYAHPAYCDVEGLPCLGGQFSVAWLEDIDYEDQQNTLTDESLMVQYERIVNRVTESHPSKYGQLEMENDKVIDFVGFGDRYSADLPSPVTDEDRFRNSGAIHDALYILERKIDDADDEMERNELIEQRINLWAKRRVVDDLFSRIMYMSNRSGLEHLRLSLNMDMMSCYKDVVEYFKEHCINISKNTYTMSHLHKLANLCVDEIPSLFIIQVLDRQCTEEHRFLNGVH